MTNHGIIYDSYWSDGFRGIAENKYFDYCPVVFQLAKRISDIFLKLTDHRLNRSCVDTMIWLKSL
jgi:hypothetical protein